jgi:hypothetical protein
VKTQKEKAWFRTFGGRWGVRIPATWRGWLVIAMYIGLGVVGYVNDADGLYFSALIITLLVTYHLKSEQQSG